MSERLIRIVIADDHALFRQGLRSLLRAQPDIEMVAEVDTLSGLAALLKTTTCDIVLLDLQMERDAVEEIQSLSSSAKIIVVTASEQIEQAAAAIRAGALAVVFKRFAVDTLLQAIESVMSGGVWMPPAVQQALVRNLRGNEGTVGLTARELEIVRLVGLGLRNAEIAAQLSISERTVKTHLTNIFPKADVRDRLELALFALETGIARLGSKLRRRPR